MNFENIVKTAITPLITGFVALARMSDPTASDAALADAVEGDIKHALRLKIGWAVDILWSFSEFQTLLAQATDAAIAASDPHASILASITDPTLAVPVGQ